MAQLLWIRCNMLPLGIGTDIVDIKRIDLIYRRYTQAFPKRILNSNERLFFEAQKPEQRIYFLAKRFCAKESIMKAMGTGCSQGVSFQNIEIDHNEKGQPQVQLWGKASECAKRLGITKWMISISDEKAYAFSVALAFA